MSRQLGVTLHDLLELVAKSEDYGQDNPVFMARMAQLTGPVTDEEIQAFSDVFRTEAMLAQGVTEHYAVDIGDRIVRWRARFLAA